MAFDYSRYVKKNASDGVYTAGEIFDEDGTFVRTRFKSDNGFVIAVFEPSDPHKTEIACKGDIVGYQEGMPYHLVGKIVNDKQWGLQVNIATAEPRKPTGRDEIIAFLGSGMIKGIGKATAGIIYKTFGDETDKILSEDPDRLSEVPGIGPKKLATIKQQLEEVLVNREIIGFFAQYGISQTVINTLIREYSKKGKNPKEIISRNPYILIRVKGFAFTRADAIAKKMGVTNEDPRRLYAGVWATLRYACQTEGHTLMPRDQLIDLSCQKLQTDNVVIVEKALDRLLKPFKDQDGTMQESRLVEDGDGIHLRTLYEAEKSIKQAVKNSKRAKRLLDDETTEKHIAQFERQTGFSLTDEQKAAVRNAFSTGLSCITGSAGCGKTALVRILVSVAHKANIGVCLMSPTGRAAKHLSEVCDDEPAYTVHRALALAMHKANDDDFFDSDETVQLASKRQSDAADAFKKASILLVDEASMLDTSMAAALMRSARGKHVVLVGDYQQLPSVGPGQVFFDLIEGKSTQVTRLTKIFRQAEGSPIIEAANLVLEGKSPCYVKGVRFFPAENHEVQQVLAEKVLPIVADDMKTRDIMFLSPMRKTPVSGVSALNDFLRPIMNPHYVEPENENVRFIPQRGDIIMQMKNNYDIDAFNGDLGIVSMVDSEGALHVSFDGTNEDTEVIYEKDEVIGQLSLAYSSTVHKSQGGQAKTVVGILTSSHFIMASRNILYTMLTRAQDRLVLVGDPKTFAMAARNNKTTQRMTGLRDL